nr:TPA_asm: ATP8 [Bombus supremus]
MPQMMPINWLIIFIMCLMCILIIMMLMNSLILFYKNKNMNNSYFLKKWKWLW